MKKPTEVSGGSSVGTRFHEVVEAVDQLSLEEQEELVSIVQRRVLESKRKRLLRKAKRSRAEFDRGELKEMTVEEIMRELGS